MLLSEEALFTSSKNNLIKDSLYDGVFDLHDYKIDDTMYTKTGKMYVGSAYGDECIWSRWKEYAINGHGGNVELKELLSQEGKDYTIHFRYSILELCNMNLGSEYIIERESYWKEILMTR